MGRKKMTSSLKKFEDIKPIDVVPQEVEEVSVPIEPPVEPKVFTKEEAEQALLYLEEMMERIQCHFVLLNETSWAIKHNEHLNVQEIEACISQMHFNGAKSLLNIVWPDLDPNSTELRLDYHGFPIKVRILPKNDYISNPDTVFWGISQFEVPNPFNEYWEHRSEI